MGHRVVLRGAATSIVGRRSIRRTCVASGSSDYNGEGELTGKPRTQDQHSGAEYLVTNLYAQTTTAV